MSEAGPLARRLASGTPVAMTLLLLLFSVLPYGVPRFAMLCPFFALISVHFWAARRPDLLPIGAAFLIGILSDMLRGGPLGLGALQLVLVHWLAARQARFFAREQFVAGWSGLVGSAALAGALEWIGNALHQQILLDPRALLLQVAMTAAIYPVFARACGGWHRWIARPA